MKRSNDSGQALVEVAISLSIFLLLAMGTVDFAFMFNNKLTLQNAVRQAGRYAITGNCIQGANGCSLSRYNSIIQTLENASDGLINANNVSTRRHHHAASPRAVAVLIPLAVPGMRSSLRWHIPITF